MTATQLTDPGPGHVFVNDSDNLLFAETVIHTVITDNGTQFTTRGNKLSAAFLIREAFDEGEPVWAHAFEYGCATANIDNRLTRPNHPWTNGQFERMNRTLKEATVRKYHYASHDELRNHLSNFVNAYNFAKRLKTLKGMTVFEFISTKWTKEPEKFRMKPGNIIPGPNIKMARFSGAGHYLEE